MSDSDRRKLWSLQLAMATVHYSELAESDVPFVFVADRLFGGWGRWAAVIATVMASLSAFSVTLGASARVLYALGRDRHFPAFFASYIVAIRLPTLRCWYVQLSLFSLVPLGS